MLRILLCAVALVFGLLLQAAPASASAGPPVAIRLVDMPGPAEAGRPFRATIEITAMTPILLDEIRCEGEGWRTARLGSPPAFELAAGESVRIPLEAVANDPDKPLRVVVETDRRPVERTFDLSPGHHAARRGGGSTRVVAEASARSATQAAPIPPLPRWDLEYSRPDHDPPDHDHETKDAGPRVAAYDIRVMGHLLYVRPDKWVVGSLGATVRVMDNDTGPDEELAVTTTDASGYFDVTFTWDPCGLCDQTPDLYVQFEAGNIAVEVEDATWEYNYRWNTPTWDNYTGAVLDIGSRMPNDPAEYPALHILDSLSKTWIRCNDELGYNIPDVDVQWPDGADVSYYNSFFQEIHLTADREWNELTHIHEYGHHWVNRYAHRIPPDYCNFYCDDGPDDCGHCYWCREDAEIAFSEGFPHWFAASNVDWMTAVFMPAPLTASYNESVDECQEDGLVHDAYQTEGIFAALLRDIEDPVDTADDDNSNVPGGDATEFGFSVVMNFIDEFEPTTPAEFLAQAMDFYVGNREQIWETASNVGYVGLDLEPPPAIADLSSPTHETGLPSPDATVHLAWTRPADDASGVSGYSVEISTGGPVLPDQFIEIYDVTVYDSPILAPGTYWINLRTVDRVGSPSVEAASFGPVIIREPYPSNLVYWGAFEWSRPLIPHPAPDVVWDVWPIEDPLVLTGGLPTTYLNLFAANVGEAATGVGPWAAFWADEELLWTQNWSPLAENAPMVALNAGPITVPTGRHTLCAMLDAMEEIPEVVEIDNFEGHQWIWTPEVLSPDAMVVRNAPPWKIAGWDFITDGQTRHPNCDGFRYDPTGWWQVVCLVPHDPVADYDLHLHEPSTGAGDGFDTHILASTRGAGVIDAIIINGNQVAWQTWDVGVVNHNYAASDYGIVHTNSQQIPVDARSWVSLRQDQMLEIREFLGGPGEYTVDVQSDNPGFPVNVALLEMDYTGGGMDGFTNTTVTDQDGHALLHADLDADGWHGIVVWLDSLDPPIQIDVALTPGPIKPELYPPEVVGWSRPLVPRPTDDATYGHVRAPAMLHGDTDSTFFNVAMINDSPATAIDAVTHVYLDWGNLRPVGIGYPDFVGTLHVMNILSAVPIPAGRHTLWMIADPYDVIAEQDELNNLYGEQWVWTPTEILADTPVIRAAPPWHIGGLSAITVAEPMFYNCDGVRTPVFTPGDPGPDDGWWACAAMLPGDGGAYDLNLHPLTVDAKTGFEGSLAWSGWAGTSSDFVLANLALTPEWQYDLGVVAYANQETADYLVRTSSSVFRGSVADSPFGPYNMDAQEIVHLHVFDLAAGNHVVELHCRSGSIDWGVSMYPNDQAYVGKSDALPGALARMAGPGLGETFTVALTDPGRYLLAVWKAGNDDRNLSASYALEIGSDPSAVPEPVPRDLVLKTGAPNPFNPVTKIRFSVPRQERAELAIYDPRGRLVRTLVEDVLPAGWHEATWRGKDDQGRGVSSGMYFCILQAESGKEVMKLTLVR